MSAINVNMDTEPSRGEQPVRVFSDMAEASDGKWPFHFAVIHTKQKEILTQQ